MSTVEIIESRMRFGPYPFDTCFHIEKSKSYTAICDGVKIAEFLLLRTDQKKPPALLVVEAKKSTPKRETQPNFDEFIAKIREKLVNSLSLTWALCLKRHSHADLGIARRIQNVGLVSYRCEVYFGSERP